MLNSSNEMRAIAMTEDICAMVPEILRPHIALSAEGHLLITQEKIDANKFVFLSTEQRLRQAGVVKTLRTVSSKELADFQSKAEELVSESVDSSDMQKEVINIIDAGIKEKASDIHVIVRNGRTSILFRCLGELDNITHARYTHSAEWGMSAMRCIYQSMTDVSGIQFSTTEPQDASMARDRLPSELFGGRIATTPTFNGHYMVIRLLYRGANTKTLAELGYNEKQIKCIEYVMSNPSGIILFAGTTGSGKTTTIASCLEKLYQNHDGQINIVTVEDPVEFVLPGNQITVTAESEDGRVKAYSRATKSFMRLDPDVCMISELRDKATIEQAIQMALTGHQVYSTVHAIDSTSILPRMEMYGISRDILADNKLVTALIAQTLVKKLCDSCKVPYNAVDHAEITQDYAMHLSKSNIEAHRTFYKGKGCECCDGTGYDGRTVLAEVVIPDGKYMEYYRSGERTKMRDHAFKESQWVSRHQHAREKIQSGLVDPRDVEKSIGPLNSDLFESDNILTMNEIWSF